MTTPQFSFDEINEKVAVINGGSGVLCGDFARALAGIGAKIALLDINKNAAQKAAGDVVKLSGAQVIGIACDVLSKESLEAARIQINSEFGPIDILVNGAGGNAKSATTEIEQISDMFNAPKSFYGLEIDGFNSVFNLNFIGTLLPTQILSQDMSHKKSDVVVNILSMAAFLPLSKIPAYSAAKAAVSNITDWLAVHLAPMGIRVNVMASGFFLTQQLKFLAFDEAGNLTPRYKRVIGKTAIKRLEDHEEF